jgi:hypothetical protein
MGATHCQRLRGDEVTQPILPIIHLNGTSADQLLDDYGRFYDLLYKALDRIGLISPNPRDYYPEPGRMDKAVAQYERRCDTLRALMHEVEQEMDGILAQRGA